MSEQVQSKLSEIDKAANEMQRTLEKEHVRKLQRKSFICGAKCCENTTCSAEEVQHCIEMCQRPLLNLQNNVKRELERFQDRIQRCMMSCQDFAQDNVAAVGETAAKEKFNNCLYKCADEHLNILPEIKSRLLKSLQEDL